MMRPRWSHADLHPELHTQAEERILVRMLDADGDPKPRFATWTPAQALAHVRNLATEQARAVSHETGATK